jgi:hypothetical protein
MACNVWGGSCSLCPYCGTTQCPQMTVDTTKYWVYVVDLKRSCYEIVFKANFKKDIRKKLEKLRIKKSWPKKNTYAWRSTDNDKVERYDTQSAQVVITDGEYNWSSAIRLIIDVQNHKIVDKSTGKLWKGDLKFI